RYTGRLVMPLGVDPEGLRWLEAAAINEVAQFGRHAVRKLQRHKMRGRELDLSTPWCLRAGRPYSFGRCDRVPRPGDIGDWHVDRAQVHRGVVADCPGQAGVPGPVVISESSQDAD